MAQQWSRAEDTWEIGLRRQRRGQDRTENRREDRTKDRVEDRTRDTTEDRTGQDRSSTCVFSHSTAAIRRLSTAQQWSMTEYT